MCTHHINAKKNVEYLTLVLSFHVAFILEYFACVTFMGTEMLFQWKRGQIENY
jgi:hypothetical protein